MNDIREITRELLDTARARRHRVGMVLAGSPSWCRQQAGLVFAAADQESAFWISDDIPASSEGVSFTRARQMLGKDLDAVVFDAWSGFDPDALGVISGTVRAGGIFLMLTPPLAEWPKHPDPQQNRFAVALYPPEATGQRFIQRLADVFREQSAGITLIEETRSVRIAKTAPDAQPEPAQQLQYGCLTGDQQAAVAGLLHVVNGQRRRPVVLSADRGRGKSAALGLAVAELFKQGIRHVVVTAPQIGSLDAVFEQAERMLPGADRSGSGLEWQGARLEFVAPDPLLHAADTAELVLVDEAAAISTEVLEGLLLRFPRIAFATTVHGYEGTGRGFTLRFSRILDHKSRGWKTLKLDTPVRWASADPLEACVFKALLLNAAAVPADKVKNLKPGHCEVERLDRDELIEDETALNQLFGLLVNAHYRTRPMDLRHLLDAPNLSVFLLRWQGQIVGVALLAREGGFDDATAHAIRRGESRPRGHLIPEALAAHLGLHEAAKLICARVMRIAVHPAVQGMGLGHYLLGQVKAGSLSEGVDLIASSFGATAELLNFWQHQDYQVVRLGLKRGAASGAHSALVVQGLSEAGTEVARRAERHFQGQFAYQLGDALSDLEPALALQMLPRNQGRGRDSLDQRDIDDFVNGNRAFEDCQGALWRWLLDTDHGVLPTPQARVLVAKILQRKDWDSVAAMAGVSGRKEVMAEMRSAVRCTL